MNIYIMTEAEQQFANLVWDNEPLGSGELVKLCMNTFGWKKSTTYTVLRKLCDHAIFRNENAVVSSLATKEEYARMRGELYIEENYGGELPLFIAAFISGKKLTKKQADEIARMIEVFKDEE